MLTLFLFGIWGGPAGAVVPSPLAILFSGETLAAPVVRDDAVTLPRLTDEQVID